MYVPQGVNSMVYRHSELAKLLCKLSQSDILFHSTSHCLVKYYVLVFVKEAA